MAKHMHCRAQMNHLLKVFFFFNYYDVVLFHTFFLCSQELSSSPNFFPNHSCAQLLPDRSSQQPGLAFPVASSQHLPDRCICCSRSSPFSNGPGGTGLLSPHKHVTGQKTFINGPCTVRTSSVSRCIIEDTFCSLVWWENMPLSLVSLQPPPHNVKITSELSDHMCVSLSTQSPNGCLFLTLAVLEYFCSSTDKLCVNYSRAEVVQALTKMFWDQLIGKVFSTLTEFSLGH